LLKTIEKGGSLESALREEHDAFGPVFVAMAAVGEQTGRLPEVFEALEKYYLTQQRFWRQVVSRSFYPLLLFAGACFLIARRLGHDGVVFLGAVAGIIAVLYFGWTLLRRRGVRVDLVHRGALGLPAIGRVLTSMCLARLALSMSLTMDSTLPLDRAVRLCFRATGNDAFARDGDEVAEAVRAGDDLTTALGRCRLLPEEFVGVVASAEQSGRVPEAMAKQSVDYEESAFTHMGALTQVAGFALWAIGAAIIGMAILVMAAFVGLGARG
jgi:type IV pilus assembly protein PilC